MVGSLLEIESAKVSIHRRQQAYVSSERVFSTAGEVLTDEIHRLSPDIA